MGQSAHHDVVTLMDLLGILGHRKKLFALILFIGWLITGLMVYYKPVEYSYTQLLEPAYTLHHGEKNYLDSNNDVIVLMRTAILANIVTQLKDARLRDKLLIRPLENTPFIVISLTVTRAQSAYYVQVFPMLLAALRQQQDLKLKVSVQALQQQIEIIKQQIAAEQKEITDLNNQLFDSSATYNQFIGQAQFNELNVRLLTKQNALVTDDAELQSLLIELSGISPARYINELTRSSQPVGLPGITLAVLGALLTFIAAIVIVFTFEALMATRRAIKIRI